MKKKIITGVLLTGAMALALGGCSKADDTTAADDRWWLLVRPDHRRLRADRL